MSARPLLSLVWWGSCLAAVVAVLASSSTADQSRVANVLSVESEGRSGEYRFAVEISSPDTGCEQYANWWEVLSEEGELIYRRVLGHSHVDEQPFVRSGGPVEVRDERIVWVRAHMHPTGYGGMAFHGSVKEGFVATELSADFALDVAEREPLPDGCRF